jgi:hypothetical protein
MLSRCIRLCMYVCMCVRTYVRMYVNMYEYKHYENWSWHTLKNPYTQTQYLYRCSALSGLGS